MRHIFHNIRKYKRHFSTRWVNPVFSLRRLIRSGYYYLRYFSDWARYSSMSGSEPIRFIDSYPCLFERIPNTPFDPHYFYQDIWAFNEIKKISPENHVDIG